MRKAVTLGLAAACLALPLTYVIAGSREPEPVAAADRYAADELLAQLRSIELQPVGVPLRRGPYYVLHAVDARGRTLRVVADAELGDIVSLAPLRQPRWHLQGGPRIIHIPDPSERLAVREAVPEDAPADVELLPSAPAAVPPRPQMHRVRRVDLSVEREQTKPRRPHVPAVAARPAPAANEHRTILSAPPPAPEPPRASAPDPLTPIYPTPKFGAPNDAASAAAASKTDADASSAALSASVASPEPANASDAAPADAAPASAPEPDAQAEPQAAQPQPQQ